MPHEEEYGLLDFDLIGLTREEKEARIRAKKIADTRFERLKDFSSVGKVDHNLLDEVDEKKKSLQTFDIVATKRGAPKPRGILGHTFDILQKGSFFNNKVMDVLINESPTFRSYIDQIKEDIEPKPIGQENILKTALVPGSLRLAASTISSLGLLLAEPNQVLAELRKARSEGLEEIIPGAEGKERLYGEDVIKRYNPSWSTSHPRSTALLGFINDIVNDPINLATFGTGSLLKGATSVISKVGKILPLSKAGYNVFSKAVDISKTVEGLEGLGARRHAEKIMQEIIEPSKSERITPKKLLERSQLLRTDLESRLANAVVKREAGAGQAARIVDINYLSEIIRNKRLPEVSVTKTSEKEIVEKLAHGGEFGFSIEAINRVRSGYKYFRIDRSGKINPILNTVDAVDVKALPGQVKFVVNPNKTTSVLDGKLSKLQSTNLNKFRSSLESLETSLELEKTAKKTAKLIEASPITGNILDIGAIIGKTGEKSSPLLVIYPGRSVTNKGQNLSKVLVDPFDIEPEQLRFMIPGNDKVFTIQEATEMFSGTLKQTRQKIAERLKIKSQASVVLQEMGLKHGKNLLDKGGLKFLGQTVISSDNFRNFATKLNIPRIIDAIEELPGLDTLRATGKVLARKFNLNNILERDFPEWVTHRLTIEGDQFQSLRDGAKVFQDMFGIKNKEGKTIKFLNEKEREEIGNFMAKVGEVTQLEAEKLGLERPSFELGERLFHDMFNQSSLSIEQKAVVAKLRQSYNNFANIELGTDLLQDTIINYHPFRYELIRTPDNYKRYRMWLKDKGIRRKFTPGEVRQFESIEQAEKAGFKPILDAGKLYALRYLEHRQGLRQKQFKKFIDITYGKNAPIEVEMDLMRLGETFRSKGFDEEPYMLLDLVDLINSGFKRSATIVRPAFAPKQAIGNFTQALAAMGTDAFKIFDPTVAGDSISFMLRGQANFSLVDVFGVKYSPKELTELAKKFALMKSTAIEGIGAPTKSHMVNRITSDLYTQRGLRPQLSEQTPKEVFDGMVSLIEKGSIVLHIPQYVEDFFRLGGFFGGLKAGHSPEVAARLSDKAFFNYTSGLTEFEKGIRRFIIPFYSFQKFGVELLGKTLLTTPGRLATVSKTMQEVFKTWNKVASGETLTENQRSVLPDYLFEQPHTFERFEQEGVVAKFKTFNSMSFLDVVNFLQFDAKDEFSVVETFTKGILAQLSPYLKIPLETAILGRELFTNRSLNGVFAGGIGDVDSNNFIRNLTTMAGAHVGVTGAALGTGVGTALANIPVTEELIKKFIGWEEGIDNRTGKKQVYINPFMLTVTTSLFPGLREGIKASRNDLSFWDKVLSATFGINTVKRYLALDADAKIRRLDSNYKEKVREINQYMASGRVSSSEKALIELEDILEYNKEEIDKIYDAMSKGEIKNIFPSGD